MMVVANRQALLRAAATMPPARARMVLREIIASDEASLVKDDPSSLEEAAATFEKDMAPVRKAIVSALTAGDMEALRGLRAMLPHLLAEVNRSPALADLLALQLGKSLVEGLTHDAEDGALRSANGPWSEGLHPRGGKGMFSHKGTSREPRSRGQDQFGHLSDEHGRIDPEKNIARGHRVISFLQSPGQKVEKAMFRPDVGAVGMEYGKPDHETGWGNSHIESKHGKAALAKVPEIIQHGTLYPHKEDGKQYLFHGDDILILRRKSNRQSWTVSSFEDSERIEKATKAKGETP